jgi:hypothetical protein
MIKEHACPEFSIMNKFCHGEVGVRRGFFSLEITVTMGNYKLSAREKPHVKLSGNKYHKGETTFPLEKNTWYTPRKFLYLLGHRTSAGELLIVVSSSNEKYIHA